MATALVRDLDDGVYERLKVRAVVNNRTLEAFEVALATRRTVYDSSLALAERMGCLAVTADMKLYHVTRGGPYAAGSLGRRPAVSIRPLGRHIRCNSTLREHNAHYQTHEEDAT